MAFAMTRSQRNGVIGFFCSIGFLGFVSKFNDLVSSYQARKNIKRKMKHWGKIVKSIVTRNFLAMRRLLFDFAGATVGLALLNAMLKYYISTLKEQVREKLTNWCHEKYMRPKDMIFYKANKVGDDKLDNLDHRITSDVDKFAEIFAMVLSQSLKPIVDFVVYSVELSRVQGLATPLTLYSWFAFASIISTVTLPPFGELSAQEQHLEGEFRGAHSKLIANCEQIAFLGGEGPEKRVLNVKMQQLLSHLRKSTQLNFNSETVRQYLNKYFVTVIGLSLVARPVRLGTGGMATKSPEEVSQYFVSTWRNMEAISTSIQDLFELTNRIGRLSGFSSRVWQLMCGLQMRPPVLHKEIDAASKGNNPPVFKEGEDLKFENVSVYRPDGTLLVANLNFEVKKGSRVLVTGTNGCGKSSLFRVIRKLWPLVSGTITMPEDKNIYFLTQVNFVPVGTLRDIIIYPHTQADMAAENRTDEEVRECLRWAHCSPEVKPEEGRADLEFMEDGSIFRPDLDDERDWVKDLSPGQKQKLAFARLFYHKPSFVVLDECTNGISPDVEKSLYERCTTMNLGVFSISHKIELKEFHDFELHYRGDISGSWELLKCADTKGVYVGSKISKGGKTMDRAQSELTEKQLDNATAGNGAGGKTVGRSQSELSEMQLDNASAGKAGQSQG